MKYTALQIVDFNNPISMEYMEGSQKTFECVKDVLDIVPVQCYVPDTIPEGIYSDKSPRSPTERAIAYTHYSLVERIAGGERIIIMEHDAYLIPEREDIFRLSLAHCNDFKLWNCGIALECYTLQKAVALNYCRYFRAMAATEISGPMNRLHVASDNTAEGMVLWPRLGQKNLSCISDSVYKCNKGDGIVQPAPVTQFIKRSLGVTNVDKRTTGWAITEKKNPDIIFI